MRGNFRREFVTGLIGLALLSPSCLMAGDGALTAWQNLQQLRVGQETEVKKTGGATVRGTFVGFADESIALLVRQPPQQEITIARNDVWRVRVRPARNKRYVWAGAAIGAAAGAGVGAGLGEQLANESGGDLRNLKPAIIAVCAGAGALAGALTGSALGGRYATIYAK